ncbi:hypothetical protein AZH53_06075 [Methanomicrobiaceae archaeon CYW5]|nr:hypothetical protein [Methanovulcanius yangii]
MSSIFNHHLFRCIRVFLFPEYSLIRTYQLACAAQLTPVEVTEPAVCASLGPVQNGNDNSPFVQVPAFLKYMVWAYGGTEVTTLAPPFVYD